MHANSLSNTLLIAMPGMQDPNFARTVSLLCQHTADGALGLTINKLANFRLVDLLDQMNIATDLPEVANAPVFAGGPVQPERGFVVHEAGGEWHSTLKFSDELWLTTSRDILEAMARGAGPRRALVALGYAGWEAGQLEQEIAQNAWLSVPLSTEILFNVPVDERWSRAAQLMGVDLHTLTGYAGHA